MGMMTKIEVDNIDKLINELEQQDFKEPMENFLSEFGIVIKAVGEDKRWYNIYKNGNLVLTMVESWTLERLFKIVFHIFTRKFMECVEQDSLSLEDEEILKQLVEEERKDEKAGFRICPICGLRVRKQGHHHF